MSRNFWCSAIISDFCQPFTPLTLLLSKSDLHFTEVLFVSTSAKTQLHLIMRVAKRCRRDGGALQSGILLGQVTLNLSTDLSFPSHKLGFCESFQFPPTPQLHLKELKDMEYGFCSPHHNDLSKYISLCYEIGQHI